MDATWGILIVDDDQDALKICAKYLEDKKYRIVTARDGNEALSLFEEDLFHAVITDMVMPGLDGMGLIREIKKRNQRAAVIMMTAFASINTAVEAMKAGAADYISKPVNPDELRVKVAKALQQYSMDEEFQLLKLKAVSQGTEEIIGESAALRKTLNLITLVAPRDVPVVLAGESGTGKDLAAKAIHKASSRARGPFVAINCAAVPETLLESELFGYAKGAFTGAYGAKKGLFEEATGGTLLLDEIVDAPPSIQGKLLRVLQDGEIRRLGSTKSTPVDVRVLAATNRDLRQAIASGQFREDLFYRLSVVTIPFPPLRERKEDILLLADHFIKKHGPSINPLVRGIMPEASEKLTGHSWPGNVRELENCMKQALVVAMGSVVAAEDIRLASVPSGQAMTESSGDLTALGRAEADFYRDYFERVMRRAGGNVTVAAAIAGISRKNVYEHLRRTGLDPAGFRRGE